MDPHYAAAAGRSDSRATREPPEGRPASIGLLLSVLAVALAMSMCAGRGASLLKPGGRSESHRVLRSGVRDVRAGVRASIVREPAAEKYSVEPASPHKAA